MRRTQQVLPRGHDAAAQRRPDGARAGGCDGNGCAQKTGAGSAGRGDGNGCAQKTGAGSAGSGARRERVRSPGRARASRGVVTGTGALRRRVRAGRRVAPDGKGCSPGRARGRAREWRQTGTSALTGTGAARPGKGRGPCAMCPSAPFGVCGDGSGVGLAAVVGCVALARAALAGALAHGSLRCVRVLRRLAPRSPAIVA